MLAAGRPLIDHLKHRGITSFHHRVGLRFVAAGKATALEVDSAPAIEEVGVHLLREQEEDLFVHLRGRAENLLNMRIPVSFGITVSQVEGRDDLALVARGDARLTEDVHHERKALDITLHHHRSNRDAGILG